MGESGKRPPDIRALAGARAIPPLILVLFHFCEGHGYRNAKWFDLPVGKGYLWVEFFFALSGFVLVYVYGSRAREFFRRQTYFAFLKARLARLYPAHLAMLFVILALVVILRALAKAHGYTSIYDEAWHPIVTWPTFAANLILVQAWNIFPYLSWNGASWFVSVEFLLCLLFPIYLLIARGGWLSGLTLVVASCGALAFLAFTSRHGLDLTFHNGIYRGMAAFGAGVGLALLHNALKPRSDAWPDYVLSVMQIVVLAWLWYGIYRTGWAHRPQDIYTVLPMMALVLALSFDRGFLARGMATPILLKLGEWSYAIYIGQTALLQLLRHAQLHWYPAAGDMVFGRTWAEWGPVWFWLEPALLILACVLWGWVLFTLVEQPAAKYLRGAAANRQKPAPTA